jgi:cell wall assembly regulator SMI1
MELQERRPPAPLSELVTLERALAELGWTLPPSYKAFLARHDGGRRSMATDSYGNVICIDARDGPVLFWDHEEIPDQPDDSNLYEIAPTFDSFLDGLEDFEPLPEPQPKQPSAWRRLFGRG